jgi:hypothetical protein
MAQVSLNPALLRKQREHVMNLISDFRQLTRDMQSTMSLAAKRPEVKRETDEYLKRIRNVKSVDDFMKDDRVYNYALNAFGLKDMAYAKAFIRKVLTEGIDSPGSFTAQLTDGRFREFAETFNFARHGRATTSFSRTQEGTVDRYIRNRVEESAGSQNENLRLGLYFQRKAPTVSSVYGILADKALYTVVRTALGLPTAISGSDIDKQAALISSKLDVKDFSDSGKLAKFITRFMAAVTASGGGQAAIAASPAISLMQGSASSVDSSTLMSIQSLRRFNT